MKKEIGRLAENLVAQYLVNQGYKIVKKNFWLKRYREIDIIAKKENIYYFVEVKALKNNTHFSPELHYHQKKKEKFHKLVSYYSNRNKIDEFELILVTVQLGEKNKINLYRNV